MMDGSTTANAGQLGPSTGAPSQAAPSPAHANLWASGPVMRPAGSGYRGERVVVEVWEDGRALSITSNGATTAGSGAPVGLISAALAALRAGSAAQAPHLTLAQAPMSGAHPTGAGFLGRVIVEMWSDGPVVGVLGSDSQLVDLAVQHLASLNRQPGQTA